MTPDDRPRSRFEPPPWETEAFEQFHQERARLGAAEDLEQALQAVRQEDVEPVVLTTAEATVVSEARIEAMLAELRVEEAPVAKAGPTLVYSAVAFLGTMGIFVVVAAFVLFLRSRSAEGPASLLAALASLVMLLTGSGSIAGAVMLFRKHHQ